MFNETNLASDLSTGVTTLTEDEIRDVLDRLTVVNYGFPTQTIVFEYDLQLNRGGDFIVEITCGEDTGYSAANGYPEGAPLVVHAIYDDLAAVENWFAVLAESDLEEIKAILEESRNDYNQAVAVGWGSWIKGRNAIERNEARKAAEAKRVAW